MVIRRGLRTALAGSLLLGGTLVTAVIAGSLSASAALAASLYVTPTGSGTTCSQASPCGTIQNAIDTATGGSYSGDDVTINVAAGTYTENDTIAASSLNSLTVAGAGASTTTVNGNDVSTVFTVSNGIVTISGLTVTEGGDQLYSSLSGILNEGTLSVSNSTLSDNQSGVINRGTLTISNSTVSDNDSNFDSGGGIDNEGTMTVSDSTIVGNSARYVGGGIENSGTATISDSTIAHNSARIGGGGIDNGGYNDPVGTTDISSSIVADNLAPSGFGGRNCLGGVTNEGYNISDDNPPGFGNPTCGFYSSTTLDASLGALANNGGPTQTILPTQTSPAVVAIPLNTTLNGVQVCPRTDQRGVASTPGTNCTIGAVEVGKGAQSITFDPLANQPFGAAPFAVSATATSGLPVSFASTTPTVCSVSGSTVTVVGGGLCSIVASQAGNVNYLAATPVTQSFHVTFSSACIGNLTGPLTIASGQAICVSGGTVTNGINVRAGGALWLNNATVKGAITSTGASAVTLCGAKLSGGSTMTGTTGPVNIGGAACANKGNAMSGSVIITNNSGGVTFSNNKVSGSVSITNNSGGFAYASNTVTGTASLTGNT